MRHLLASALLLLLLVCGGCAFEDGRPWGQARFDVRVAFDPPPSRLDGDLLKTARDYRVRIDELDVTLESAELEVSSAGDVGAFDPADPPEGYSLCHNGHCHADDGSLVAYEDIALEAAGGDFVVTQALEEEAVRVGREPRPVGLGPCTADCRLERGSLTLARVRVAELRIVGEVTDTADRLAMAVPLDVVVDLDVPIETLVEGTVGPGEPGGIAASLALLLPAELFDDVDFQTSPDVHASVRDAMQSSATLDARIATFDISEAPHSEHDHEHDHDHE